MPYLKQEDQERLHVQLASIPLTGADLNFIFSVVAHLYFRNNGANYRAINDIVGALECCKLEFFRRIAAPYEDTKIEANGDIYKVVKQEVKEDKVD